MAARIIVTVIGGMVDTIVKQDCDVPVLVRDYDIDGMDEGSLSKDDDGAYCIESEY